MDHREIKRLIHNSNKITVLTGAGISTESGISDFRSPGGVWSQYKTVTLQEFLSDSEKRRYYWRYKSDTIPSMINAEPNPAHFALGKLDKDGRLFWLLTQNIDGLHEKGGVAEERIVNLHGTNMKAICWSCKKIFNIEDVFDQIAEFDYDPRCVDCNGYIKPNTVSFGQNLNPDHISLAEKASKECDLFMSLGSSLVVFPVCSFVEVAYHNKRPIIIINRDPTPYDKYAAYKLSDSLAEILPTLI
ncbi:MAG: Sir2 family NAD-dependent protein deacetylase [Spirochaetota bacterium]|nr:Sir2 family NAD-dependent protein deacetylase [Spirochaetota bacterium]